MNVLAVCMGGDEKGVLALSPAHCRFIAHLVCLLRGDLSRLEGPVIEVICANRTNNEK